MAHLVLSRVPPTSLDTASEGVTWRRVTQEDDTTDAIFSACIFLTAVAEVSDTLAGTPS